MVETKPLSEKIGIKILDSEKKFNTIWHEDGSFEITCINGSKFLQRVMIVVHILSCSIEVENIIHVLFQRNT